MSLPVPAEQAERLIELGLLGDATPDVLRAVAAQAPSDALLVPRGLAASAASAQMRREVRGGVQAGFVVEDFADLDAFEPVGIELPDAQAYAVVGLERGDEYQNASPAEASAALAARARTPLLAVEGALWVVQQPEILEPGSCFMTIGSRLPKTPKVGARTAKRDFDARTPAVWISGGTGRDGAARKGAPKLGWCWWNNRHTWLGFASAARRVAYPAR